MSDRCYRRDYQERHDIDWFATYRGLPVHVASNGGFLPKQIKKNMNKQLQRLFSLEFLGGREVLVNDAWIRELQRIRREDALYGEGVGLNVDLYLQSFVDFASKGFISIDNAIIGDVQQYVIVAYPYDQYDLLKMDRQFIGDLRLPEIPDETLPNINVEELWS